MLMGIVGCDICNTIITIYLLSKMTSQPKCEVFAYNVDHLKIVVNKSKTLWVSQYSQL